MINLTTYGYQKPQISDSGLTPARVTATHKGRYELITEFGEVTAILKSSAFHGNIKCDFPTTGDFVMINYNETGESTIIEILPRRTCFERLDPSSRGHYSQAAAANFDYVFILTSLNKDLNFNRLERYLAVSWQSGAVPIIILTKSDLNPNYKEILACTEKYAKGVCVFACSSVTGDGFPEMSEYFKPEKTIVLLGSSGVGKSSFINAMAGNEIMNVSGIREDDSKGRHTTTHRQLIMLPSGVMIIDTPGMRTLGMWETEKGLNDVFGETIILSEKCRFSNCTHKNEPGCAVKKALESGELTAERWENYNKLKREMRFQQKKDAFKQREIKGKYKRPKKSETSFYNENVYK